MRARLPQYFRAAAVVGIFAAVLAIIASFYNARSTSPFRLKSEHAQLSSDVISEISGYERVETDAGVAKYYIRADHAKTFSDDHQELANVYLEIYSPEGTADKMAAENAIYVPEPDKHFTAYLKGNVRIESRAGLTVRTNHITYTNINQTAEADETVEFERETIRGKSFGATVDMAAKRLDLHRDVDIEVFESADLAKSGVKYAKITSQSAIFDQVGNKIDLNRNVSIDIASTVRGSAPARSSEIRADRALAAFAGADAKTASLSTFELFDNVTINSAMQGGTPTNISAGYALFNRLADRYTLKNGAHIVADAGGKPTDIRAAEAVFEQTAHKLALTGDVKILQGSDALAGDTCHAELFSDNKIKSAVLRGNASASQTTVDRTTSVKAPELNAEFNDSRQLRDANAVGQSHAEILPREAVDYTKIVVDAARGIGMLFKGEGLIERMRTDGRTTVNLNAPTNSPEAANKRLTADGVVTVFQANGKDIRRTEAVGNAELFVEPITAGPANYRTTINAPRFDCDFYDTGNNARICVAGKKARAVRNPTVKTANRGDQILLGIELTANFGQRSNDIESFDATGDAKFTEADRNAIAGRMSFTRSDEVVRLRGGEPTVWDSSARAKAGEIDWDTRNNKTHLRGSVSTTYYSRKQMKDAAPFGSSEKPVFVTSQTAEIDHAAETANYLGNARGWQDSNYVRGDRIFVDQANGKLLAEGGVQSVLYNAKINQKSKESSVPTYAAAKRLTYERDKRVLQYRDSVDIRQGTDRITSGSADVYLDERNDVSRTVAENNVVITQPSRRASGDWVQYTASDETAIIRGNPAKVSDPESGTSESPQLSFSMRDKRVTSGGATVKPGTGGRTRTVYKIK